MIRTARVCVVVMPLLLAACWPAPGGGPDRSAHNRFETSISTDTVADLGQVWTADVGPVESEPVTAHGKVYVHDGTTLFGLNAATGEEVWSVDVGDVWDREGRRFHGPVIVDGERVAAASVAPDGTDPSGRWFDAQSGDLLDGGSDGYFSSIRGAYAASVRQQWDPRIGYISYLRVTNLDDGTSWSGVAGAEVTEVTVGRDLVFHVGFGLTAPPPHGSDDAGNGIRAFPLADAQTDCLGVAVCPEWAIELPGDEVFPAVLSPDGATVFAVVDGLGVYALDSASGEILWASSGEINGTASPALADGRLYVPGLLGFTYVFDAQGCGEATCDHLWLARTGNEHDRISAQPTVAGKGDTALLFTTSDVFGSVDAYPAAGCEGPQACTPIWSGSPGSTPTSPAVVSNGRVYVGTDDGLVAFGLP